MVSTSAHRYQRKRVRSVMRDGEDSCDVVVTVTNVTGDIVEYDCVSSIKSNMCR